MKKLLSLILAGALSISLAACSQESETITESTLETQSSQTQETTTEAVDVKTAVLKGPTAMGLVQFMNASETGEITDNNYTFDIVVDPAEVTALLAKGEIDIAAIPANLASVLYNNTEGAIEVLGINTLGVLYIVENGETVSSIEDLKGKTIYATGKGATPEYSLRYILSQNGIDPDTDVTIEWKSEAAEVLSAISATENAIAMLPQPFVSTALTQNENLKVVLDLTSEWDTVEMDKETPSSLITGVIVARKDFISENPEAVKAFLSHYETSVNFVNDNIDQGAVLIGQYDIVPEAIAKIAIPNSNIVFIHSQEMKDALSGYLNVLYEQNPASIGANLPDEEFYYMYENQ